MEDEDEDPQVTKTGDFDGITLVTSGIRWSFNSLKIMTKSVMI